MKNFVRRMRKIGNRGSTLIAVMVVTTILSLFLITLQPIMLNYAKGSIDERDLKQADFSARSANDAIVKGILDGNTTLISGINSISSDGSSLVLDDFTFSSSQMGSVEARIERVSANEFSVITRATVNEAQRTIGREIIKESNDGTSDPNALNSFYFHTINYTSLRGLKIVGKIPVVVANSLALNNGILNIEGNLIVYPNPSNSQFQGSSRLYLEGNLYTGNGYFTIRPGAEALIKEKTYTNTNSQISGNLSPSNKYCPDIYSVTTDIRNSYNSVPDWVTNRPINPPIYPAGTPYTGGNYYAINSNRTLNASNIDSMLSSDVTPENPVYIIVRNAVRVTLTNPLDDPTVDGVKKEPRVVFILEGNASLILQDNSTAIVYSVNSSTSNTSILYINRSSSGQSNFYGQVRVGRMINILNNNTSTNNNNLISLEYRSNNIPGTINWVKGNYMKTSY